MILENCKVTRSEVIISNTTKFVSSSKVFDIPEKETVTDISLDAVKLLPDYQVVNIMVKVVKRKEPVEVKPGLIKQNFTIADSSGRVELVLWQDDVDKLTVGESYKIEQLMVRSYDGLKFVTPPKSGQWSLDKCDDIICDEVIVEEFEGNVMVNAFVAGVMQVEMKVSCLHCKSSFTWCASESEKGIGKCTKCCKSG